MITSCSHRTLVGARFSTGTSGIEAGFPALEAAGLAGKGITIHDLRSAAISLYAASGLSLVEVAAIVGHSDATVTAKHYARLFERSDVAARVRAAQAVVTIEE
jgi:integrase